MRRREVIGGLSAAAMAWPLGLGAQPTGKPIFGILLVFSSESGRTFTDPIRAYLEALGCLRPFCFALIRPLSRLRAR